MSDVEQYSTVFKALSAPVRLRLLGILPGDDREGALSVCNLAEKLGISQPCLSHHLNILRCAGLVRFKKDGCSTFYFVDRSYVERQLAGFRKWMVER
ncbi:MAG: winged helix-turn-helix transcriptional regulator [Planctomycetes bacterium]|nr:winged helix-turn-helix transcriptional regulator [Planctomycetota bacterium]